ncbi:MAG: hypothetical protein II834_07500 [Bacteroidaceae bacterium]|nr:hypothetical protein [Bacteroidaceae bacterium]
MNGINRLVLIGNGFDLAHGLKTSYKDFISWYWSGVLDQLKKCNDSKWADELCSLRYIGYLRDFFASCNINGNVYDDIKEYIKTTNKNNFNFNLYFNESSLIKNICKSIETKGWADIEYEYYELLKEYSLKNDKVQLKRLNEQLCCLEKLLVKYLREMEVPEEKEIIKRSIYAPIETRDISLGASDLLKKYIEGCCEENQFKIEEKDKIKCYKNKNLLGNSYPYESQDYIEHAEKYIKNPIKTEEYPLIFMLPDNVMLLSFNYTNTASLYIPKNDGYFTVNYIHGKLDNPESVIFGYGDELDEKYKQLQESNDNECLKNVKSIKYLEADNYRKVLQFIESAPFQVCIMGHSCGNSDRTLLNTIFEHENCISIKPYYHKRPNGSDNYIEIVQNISRNFKDPKLMRDRVVNKYYCEPLT